MQDNKNKTMYVRTTRIRLGCVIGYLGIAVFTLPLTFADTVQQAYLKASNTNVGDYFGWALAVSGDTAVVGAREADNRTGTAYVYVRDGDSWTLQATLNASNFGLGDSFGHSVDIEGDTIVVSAEAEDSGATGVNGNQNDNSVSNSGAVYVFVRDGTTWSQQAYIKASYTDEGDRFGFSVAVSGDSLVVGAYREDSGATGLNGDEGDDLTNGAGAAYLFTRNGTFDTTTVVQHTDPPGSDGTLILTFDGCNSGTVEYNIPSINRQGIVPIQRVAGDNIALCQALMSN